MSGYFYTSFPSFDTIFEEVSGTNGAEEVEGIEIKNGLETGLHSDCERFE
jgi:hypothetical protein